jgi:hypothetical protein
MVITGTYFAHRKGAIIVLKIALDGLRSLQVCSRRGHELLEIRQTFGLSLNKLIK